MNLIYNEEFVWPKNKQPETEATLQEAIEAALEIVGGNKEHHACYIILDDLGWYPAEKLYPGATYIIKLRDNVPFTWPKDSNAAAHDADEVLEQALTIADMPVGLSVYYFIAAEPDARSLQYTSSGLVRPGRTYYLRVI